MVPIPPEVEAPPKYTEAIASNSKEVPACGVAAFRRAAKIKPAKAAIMPILTKTQKVIFLVLIPES